VSVSRPDPAGGRFPAEIVEQPDALHRLLGEAGCVAT
jgi:hypothetical protein